MDTIKNFEELKDTEEKMFFMLDNINCLFTEQDSKKKEQIKSVFTILENNKELRESFYIRPYELNGKRYWVNEDITDIRNYKDKEYIKQNINPLLEYIYDNHIGLFLLHYKECILEGYINRIPDNIKRKNMVLAHLNSLLKTEDLPNSYYSLYH